MQIRALLQADYPEVQAIYQQGIDGGDATFQTEVKDWQQWDASCVKASRLLAVEAGQVLGWACLTDMTSRCVSEGVAETSVYVENTAQGCGVGLQLLRALVSASEAAGYWTLQARIFPENVASIALHRHAGFETLGLHKKLGRLNGVWRDVLLMERRSSVTGQD